MIPQHLKMFVILHCCWLQTDALLIVVFMLHKKKVHRTEKYSVTKYRYVITKYTTGVCDTPPD